MKNKSTIAITGASGFLGSSLVEHFAGKGWHVVGLVRHPTGYAKTAAREYRIYDLQKPIDMGVLAGVDFVVHAAYVKSAGQVKGVDPNISGAENLFQACDTTGVKKIIFISSMSSHAGAISNYGKQKFGIEKLLRAHDVAIRPGLILGNGGIVQAMSQFMRRFHVVPLVGGGKQPVQVVRADEVARAVDAAIAKDLNGTFTVASTHIYTYKRFYKSLAKKVGVPIAFVPVPFFILFAAARLVRLLHLPVGISEDSVLGLKKLTSVDTGPDLASLGIEVDDLETSFDLLSE